MTRSIATLLFAAALAACGSKTAAPNTSPVEPMPVAGDSGAMEKKLDHFTMDSYPPGGRHTATIGFTIRDVLGISGKKPTMPFDKPGSVSGDDLAAIKAWTDAWETTEKGGAHPPAEDHHH